MLDGHHSPGGERASVTNPVDLIEDRYRGVAGPKEVGVERVDGSDLDGPASRHQRLAGDLAAEDPLALFVGLDSPKDVDLDGLEVEEVDEEVQRVAHLSIVAPFETRRATST